MRMKLRLEWKLADCWIGAFWKREQDGFHLWICLVPCLPLHIQIDSRSF
jgi:hypothetical protein